MSPEQCGGGNITGASDQYALGVVAYEMLAGRPPFVGEHFSGLMLDIMQRDPPPLVSLRADVPRRLASVIHRALERDLEKRYLDMQGFIVALESVGRDELKLAMETPPEGLVTKLALPRLTPAIQPAPPSPLRDRRLLTAVGAIAVGVVGGGLYLWMQDRQVSKAARPAVAIPAAVAAERQATAPAIPPEPAAPEAAKPAAAAAGVLVKHPGAAAQPAAGATEAPATATAPTPEPASPSKRSSRRRESRTGGGDRDQTKQDEASAAAAPPRTLPQRVTSQPVGRPNRAGKLSVDDF
jgi:serine/threonine-protein kinase